MEISSDVVRKEIEELLNELKDHMENQENQLEGQKAVLAFDGWTNSVTKDKHLCFVILPIEESTQPVFYESFILLSQSTIKIQSELSRIHSALTENQIYVVAIIADNAKACQAAIFNFTAQTNNRIVGIRCAAPNFDSAESEQKFSTSEKKQMRFFSKLPKKSRYQSFVTQEGIACTTE